MIKNKYKSDEIIKSKGGKVVERTLCIENNRRYVLKSYPLSDSSSIENELEVYQKVKQPHLHGIPEIKEGFQTQGRLYLTFQELGHNIEYLRMKCGGRLSLKTTLMIGIQMLERIQFLHENGFLHGDIKPSNFLIGLSGKLKHKIYLVDFQLSHPYTAGGKHIQEKNIDSFSGCLRFCSSSANSRKNICRRDEIESLIYTLIYLLKGELPWMNVEATNISEAYALIGAIKMQKKAELLQGLPETFRNLMKFVQNLKFKEKPNYGYVRAELLGLMKKNGYELDYKHDWEFL